MRLLDLGLPRFALKLTFKSFTPLFFLVLSMALPHRLFGQNPATPGELKKLSMEELLNLEVISASRYPEKLSEVASAIQVVRQQAINRSAATNLPDALRLSPNLQISQLNSYGWIIGTRGFNAIFSNKLLVMIDGRTVYSPLFAGVYWDVQNVIMEDLQRIEVVSGPGGTLWGANAVNGVINILSKPAEETPGLYFSTRIGTLMRNHEEIRYGGKIGSDLHYRVYVQHFNRNHTYDSTGNESNDAWRSSQTGFRMDWKPSDKNSLTLQGDFYLGEEETAPTESSFDGQNILGRWQHTFSENSNLTLQLYFDRTWRRDIPSTFSDQVTTYDIDLQHRFKLGNSHHLLWGAGYRFMKNKHLAGTPILGFLPPERNMDLFSSFIQDEISLNSKTRLILGTKFQHNDFSGFEVQPSARLAWTPTAQQTLWGSVSRAVRTPSRWDTDYFIPTFPLPPDQPSVAGGPNFDSEKVIAYELGYRVQPSGKASLSLATFYNRYDDLYSVEALPGTQTYQVQNGGEGYSYGAELACTYQQSEQWRLRGGYTYFNKELKSKPGHTFDPTLIANDAKHLFLLQSITNLPWNFQFDLVVRYMSELPNPRIPGYVTMDARLAWVNEMWEISIAGQNLREKRHREIGYEIPRNIYGKITWRL